MQINEAESRKALIFMPVTRQVIADRKKIAVESEENMEAGISTLGITFGYGVETTAGTKPTAFTQLHRINKLGGITIENEQIDASALEDATSRYVQGRADTGGSFPVTVNFTQETKKEWADVITAFKALSGGKRMWFETIIPGFDESFFVVAQPPTAIPQPELDQNNLMTVDMNLIIEEYKGMDATVAFTEGE